MTQVTDCYKASDVRKWFATPNSCIIISYDLFASLTGPVVHKAKRRKVAFRLFLQQQEEQRQLGMSSTAVCRPKTLRH